MNADEACFKMYRNRITILESEVLGISGVLLSMP